MKMQKIGADKEREWREKMRVVRRIGAVQHRIAPVSMLAFLAKFLPFYRAETKDLNIGTIVSLSFVFVLGPLCFVFVFCHIALSLHRKG
jgi:hypothetical protein